MRPLLRALALTALALIARATDAQPAPIRDFSALHFTDIHVDAHVARTGPPGALRGAETIRWICEQSAQAQTVPDWPGSAPRPAFALATGDLTEYGVIDDTWAQFEAAWKALACKLYVIPGNHDNTWNALYAVMRARHGGENYSFDHEGCHFVGISSASPQEPVPSIDGKTRAWLKADLDHAPPTAPVFVFLHHPLYTDEFANPAEMTTLVDLLRDYNVVLLLYGHGHSVEARDNGGLPGVMGGSTFGPKAGYGVLRVQGDRVRYAYHYLHDPNEKDGKGPAVWRDLWKGAIAERAPQRLLELNDVHVENAGKFSARVRRLGESAGAGEVVLTVDGQKVASAALAAGASVVNWTDPNCTPGAHLLAAALAVGAARDTRTKMFCVDRPEAKAVWRKQLPAGLKAAPVLAGELVLVARNDGVLSAFDKATGAERWTFKTGGEILGTPAASGDAIVCGAGDGKVYAVDLAGKPKWTYDTGLPVYGRPLLHDGVAYIGDSGGRLFALALTDGALRWKFERADFSIETAPVAFGDLLVFGAWDGNLYALDRQDGTLKWKKPGAKASDGKSARYYAPADCEALVCGDRVYAADRGYELGGFTATGEMPLHLSDKIAAVGRTADGRGFIARHTDGRVSLHDAAGAAQWSVQVAAGRMPAPPVAAGDRIYVCSDRGRLSALAAADGRVLGAYQATPGFFVMAPPAVDAAGVCYVAGIDGTVVAVQIRPTP